MKNFVIVKSKTPHVVLINKFKPTNEPQINTEVNSENLVTRYIFDVAHYSLNYINPMIKQETMRLLNSWEPDFIVEAYPTREYEFPTPEDYDEPTIFLQWKTDETSEDHSPKVVDSAMYIPPKSAQVWLDFSARETAETIIKLTIFLPESKMESILEGAFDKNLVRSGVLRFSDFSLELIEMD